MPLMQIIEIEPGHIFQVAFDYHKHSSPTEKDKIFLGLYSFHYNGVCSHTRFFHPTLVHAIMQQITKDMEENPPPDEVMESLATEMAEFRKQNLLFQFVSTDDPKVEENLRQILGLKQNEPPQQTEEGVKPSPNSFFQDMPPIVQ